MEQNEPSTCFNAAFIPWLGAALLSILLVCASSAQEDPAETDTGGRPQAEEQGAQETYEPEQADTEQAAQQPLFRPVRPASSPRRTVAPKSQRSKAAKRPALKKTPGQEPGSTDEEESPEAPETETDQAAIESGTPEGETQRTGGAGLSEQKTQPQGAPRDRKNAVPYRAGQAGKTANADTACHPLFLHRPAEARGKAGVADILFSGSGPSRSAVSRHILLNGKYLYVSGEPGLQTIDVSDPERMKLTSDWTKSALKVNGAAVKGNVLYVANWSPHIGLLLFDISNPAKPVNIKTIATPIHSWDVVVNGDLLDVSLGNETTSVVQTYDIKDPRNPVLLNTLTIDDRLIGNATRYKGFLYLTHKQLLYVYEAPDPAKQPKLVGEMSFGGLCGDTHVRGDYLYLLEGGLRVFSLKDPAKPAEVASLKLAEARGMHFQGSQVFVPASGSGIYTVDISDPAKPAVVSNWAVAWPGMGHGGYPVTVDGAGNYVFVGTTGGNNPGCADASCACYGGRVYSVRR